MCFVFSKLALIAFFVICSITFIQGNIIKSFIDDGIYAVIDTSMKDRYGDNQKKAECMSDDFRRNRIADKFYTTDVITNPEKLSKELQPYIDEADLSMYTVVINKCNIINICLFFIECEVIAFIQSPWGIGILLLLACMIILSCICCLIRCICR